MIPVADRPAAWTVVAQPYFLDQLEDLTATVQAQREKDPKGYKSKNAAKRLKMILDLMGEIQEDPSRAIYRQGNTLGDEYKHWFRAKFFQQYRLFFRYDAQAKVIVMAWVNDDGTKRAYGSKTDAYRVFSKMLAEGHPPNNWDALLKEARGATDRAAAALTGAVGILEALRDLPNV